MITRNDGDLSKLSFLKDDVINAAYLVQPPTDVAVVGVGGGRDILSALLFGAKRIHGIEINPAIFEVLSKKFANFSGHLDRQPGVSLVNAEARSYINHSTDRYDLIQISLIDTWAATAAGGLTLTENRLYTVEAWEDLYRALKPGGLLSVSRWYNGWSSQRVLPVGRDRGQRASKQRRFVERAVAPCGRVERWQHRHRDHSPGRLHRRSMAECARPASGARLQDRLGTDVAFDDVTTTLMSGKANAAFFDSLPENIAPSTDDNPFFFYTARLGDLVTVYSQLSMNNNAAIKLTRLLVVAALLACGYFIVLPFIRLTKRMPASTLAPPVAYFSAIGMGFMLIEISQMQRLMVFLGHPVYGLAVVLFTILLFSGIGSATVGPNAPRRGAIVMRLVTLLVTLAAAGALTRPVTAWGRSEATDMRILVSVALLAPPAFCMGMMFPLGLRMAPSHGPAAVFLERQRDHLDAGFGSRDGFVDRTRHRQDLRSRRLLLCPLCAGDGDKPPGERRGRVCSDASQ